MDGNWIYEGDVVSWSDSHPYVGIVEWDEADAKFYLKTYFFFVTKGLLGSPGKKDFCTCGSMLLMGNIHEPKWGIESEVEK